MPMIFNINNCRTPQPGGGFIGMQSTGLGALPEWRTGGDAGGQGVRQQPRSDRVSAVILRYCVNRLCFFNNIFLFIFFHIILLYCIADGLTYCTSIS